MLRSKIRAAMLPVCIFITVLLSAKPAHNQCKSSPSTDSCSYAGLNGPCTITIDRARPAAPPTIYARRGSKVTVNVINLSPFETLSFDFKSAQTVLPADIFQSLMSSLSGTVQKLTVVSTVEVPKAVGLVETEEQRVAKQTNVLAGISNDQKTLLAEFDLGHVLPELARIIQSPPVAACDDANTYADAVQKNKVPLPQPTPWYNALAWKAMMLAKLAVDNSGNPLNMATLPARLTALQTRIDTAKGEVSQLTPADQVMINGIIASVVQNQASITAAIAAHADLVAVISAIVVPADASFDALDLNRKDHNSLQVSWTLDYTNLTAITIKRVLTTPYKAASPLDAVLNPPSKQAIMGVMVQYQAAAKLEVATGIMVPMRPFHSYSAAAVAKNGTVTGNIVQETLTYTVVPLALVNIVLKQGIARKQPVAFFATIGAGYNPATSSVEFGVGPSFSWRSVVISGLTDIGRDTQLSGGFAVGQVLPISNPPKPLTATDWFVKPAIALSVRIPLGGASK